MDKNLILATSFGFKLNSNLKAVLHGSTCNIDFPRNTVLCFRDMLHESTFCTTVIDFLIETYMLHRTTYKVTSIRNIILVTKKLGTGKFEGETRNPLPTVISGLENLPLAHKQIFSFIKEINFSLSTFVIFLVSKTRILLLSTSKDC